MLIKIIFYTSSEYVGFKYTGQMSPEDHLDVCLEAWQEEPHPEWVHMFVSTLDTIPKN